LGGKADTKLASNFAQTLFNLVINPSKAFKQQFLDEQGIFILKKLLAKSFDAKDFEIYFYCLGLVPAIASVNVKDFSD
jgi:hypothetical protein